MDTSQFQPELNKPPVAQGPQVPQEVPSDPKQALLDMISQIKGKLSSLKALRFASDNKTEKNRRDLLLKVFKSMQSAGVDLSDQKSVSNFIEKIRTNNPELAQMFEEAMSSLLGEDTTDFTTPEAVSTQVDLGLNPENVVSQNMNNQNQNPNETIPQDI